MNNSGVPKTSKELHGALSYATHHKRQAATLKSWDQCLATGKNIMAAIECQGERPQQYNDFEELHKAGYTFFNEEFEPSDDRNYGEIHN